MNKEKIKKSFILFTALSAILSLGTFASFDSALAQNCPSSTTVSGTTVNFVGELMDLGGEANADVWFEYGQTSSYGQTTSQQTLTQLEYYCATVSGLSSCTTYHYRAVASNSAGTGYGEDRTFTTSCANPTVDLRANGSDGSITISSGSSANLSWSSSNADSCSASGDWSGTKSTSGSESTQNLTSSRTYTLTCSGTGGSASDSVTVNISSPSLSVSLSAFPSAGCAPLNEVDLTGSISGSGTGDVTYFFDCTNDASWERIFTTSSNSYTAQNLCSYTSAGTYTARIRAERQGQSAENTLNINPYSCYSSAGVDLKANGIDGSITIPYNTSATLSWTSSNATYCSASGGWSGTKSTYGSESTGNLTSSRSYTIACSGQGGSNTDSVTVNVSTVSTLAVNKLVRNLSNGTAFLDSVTAEPLDVLSFSVTVTAGNSSLDNVIIRDTLPDRIVFRQNSLKVGGLAVSGDIASGYNMGSFSANQTRTITFDADILGGDRFSFGNTSLINSVTVSNSNTSGSDTATIVVNKTAVAGATSVSTGLTNNIFVDSFVIPLAIALLLIYLLKARIIKFEQWLDKRKNQYQQYKSEKTLKVRIKKIRLWELLKRI